MTRLERTEAGRRLGDLASGLWWQPNPLAGANAMQSATSDIRVNATDTANRMDELRDLSDAATPGPWYRQTVGHADADSIAHIIRSQLNVPLDEGLPASSDATWIESEGDPSKSVAFVGNGPRQTENGDFIAAAVNYVRARLASTEADQAETPGSE